MSDDFMTNLAERLTHTLLEAGAQRLNQTELASEERRVLGSALETGFQKFLVEESLLLLPNSPMEECLSIVGQILGDFLCKPDVANNILALTLAGESPDLLLLALRFGTPEFDGCILRVDFQEFLRVFHQGITETLFDAIQHGEGQPSNL